VPRPRCSLADFVAHREEDLPKLLIETPLSNLQLIAATHGNLSLPQPSHSRRVALMRALRRLACDFVLFDLGAGVHPAVMDYFMIGEDGVVVVVPEPTSIENAYAFMKAAFYRRLRLAMLSHDVRRVVTLAMDERNDRGIRTPFDLLREVEALDPLEGARFAATMKSFRPCLVVNEVRTAKEIRLGFSIRSVCRRYFGLETQYLGYVNHDDLARRSIAERRPLLDSHPRSEAAVYIDRIARKLASARQAES
jgi:flagellar biosynthesis protein FlhG